MQNIHGNKQFWYFGGSCSFLISSTIKPEPRHALALRIIFTNGYQDELEGINAKKFTMSQMKELFL